jgi:hypothetical protein
VKVFSGIFLLVAFTLVALAMVGGIAWSGIAYLLRRRALRAAPARSTAAAAGAAGGPWRLDGRIGGADAERAPVSGRACAAWVLEIEERREPDWVPVRSLASERPFNLDDGSGAVEVRPARALFSLAMRGRTFDGEKIDAGVRALLFDEGEGEAAPRRSWRVVEKSVGAGARLEAVGWVEAGALAARSGRVLVLADEDVGTVVGGLAGRAVLAIATGALLLAWIAGSAVWTVLKLRNG